MDFTEHVIISAAGSAAIAAGGGGWEGAAAFTATGVFIDLDHFVDYWRETGHNWDIPRFLKYFDGRKPRKLLLVAHAWEWVALIWAACALGGAPAWAHWGCFGWLIHLALDHRFNQLAPLAYFFSYRLSIGFNAKPLFRD